MQENITRGGMFAIGAFLLWGGFPLYFKAVADVPALELLAHRALWVLLTLFPLIIIMRMGSRVRQIFAVRGVFRVIFLSSSILTLNWLIFVWAIANDYVLQSSLGYYINPLINVLLGVVLLRERLRPVQWVAVALAVCGVAVMVGAIGELPWVALSLALTFAVYGFLRKQAPVEAVPGLFSETLIVAPLALAYLGWLWMSPQATAETGALWAMAPVVTSSSGALALLVMAGGVVTALPLALFAAAARRLPLSMLGFCQYITPTGHFVLAVFVFHEPFGNQHLASFALIWGALALYTYDMLKNRRHEKRMAQTSTGEQTS